MIKNKTKRTIVAKEAIFCRSLWSKTVGLMFSKQKSLIFVFCREQYIPIHMIFVFFPIDVVYLDKKKKVVEIKENLKPFRFYNPKKKATYLVEAAQNAVVASKTRLNDVLEF